MQIFITGANGFIGGAVASALVANGHAVRGLVRSKAKVDAVAACGVEAVVGSLDDAALLQAEARAADAVINAASSDHRGAVEALIAGLSGSGKPLIHSSGSSIVADLAMGEPSDRIFHEATPIEPHADKAARVAIDRLVLAASGIRSVVLCNTMIYGNALGAPAQSVQIPALLRQAKASGVARYIGRGLNRWSNVHIADVATLYTLALAKAPAGTFMYVESGEEALAEISKAIAARLGLGVSSMPISTTSAAAARSILPPRSSRSWSSSARANPVRVEAPLPFIAASGCCMGRLALRRARDCATISPCPLPSSPPKSERRGSRSASRTSPRSMSRPSSTPPTERCSGAAASTAPSIARRGLTFSRSVARSAAATPARPRSPAAIASKPSTSSTPSGRCGAAAARARTTCLRPVTARRWRSQRHSA